MVVCFFFCKQKTADELRISDWSSDVCSSDLPVSCGAGPARPRPVQARRGAVRRGRAPASLFALGASRPADERFFLLYGPRIYAGDRGGAAFPVDPSGQQGRPLRRPEEHTSELQSLMRISYDVFCLKKKTQLNNTTHK